MASPQRERLGLRSGAKLYWTQDGCAWTQDGYADLLRMAARQVPPEAREWALRELASVHIASLRWDPAVAVCRVLRSARPRGAGRPRTRTSRVTRAGPDNDDPDLADEPPPRAPRPKGVAA